MSARPDLDPPPGPLVLALARVAARLLPVRGPAPAPDAIRRVLVVRPDDRVGNALLTIPLARALANLLPQARIDLLLAARRAYVSEGLPGLRVIHFDKRDLFRHPLRFLGFLRALRREEYDVAIDAAHWHSFSLTSALLARWAGRRAVIGSERGPAAFYTARVPLPPPGEPEVASKLRLVQALGLSAPPGALETSLGASAQAQAGAARLLAEAGLEARFALLNPGARKQDHRWPASRYAEVARALHDRAGVRSLLTWGPGEELLVRTLHEAAPEATVLAPPTDLDQLAALLRRCAVAVTNDTGPMHLAVACGAPVAALFLAADGARWAHPGPRFRAVLARPGDEPRPEALAAAALELLGG